MHKKISVGLRLLMIITFAASLCSCPGQSGGYAPSLSSSISISPSSATLAFNNLKTFSASGGLAPYSFSVISGSGSILSTTGIYTAPNSVGSGIVRVTDSAGLFVDATVTINSSLQIAPVSQAMAPSGTLSFTSVGGVAPVLYSVSSGLGSIDSTTGVYTAAASVGSANVTVTDSYGNTSVASINITNVLNISPTTKTLAVSNSAAFVGSGGTSPYVFSKVSGVGSINASTGIYLAGAVAGSAVVRVTDSIGATASANVTVNAALSLSPSTQTIVINGILSFSAAGGVSPYTYSIVSGSGVINSSTGNYTAPSSSGTDVVRVSDSLGNFANATITINNALGISPATKTLAVGNTFTFTASGGVSPYTYSLLSGGGSINATTGAYTAPATAGSAIIRVTDSGGNTSNSTVTINAALAISPASATVVTSGTQSFTSTGGVSSYVYSIVTGGGSINSSTGLFTAPGTSGSVTVRSTDSVGNTSSAAVTVIIASSPFSPQNFSVSGTYVVPSSGCTSMVVKIWGGGGGAGGGYSGYLGLNGGTGDYRSGTITVVAGDTLNVHLGLKGMGGANGSSYPAAGGAGGTTTGTGNGAAGGASLASGGGGGGGGGASSILNGSGTTLVLTTGGGGGAGASVNSGSPALNIGGSGSLGAGLNDSGTYASCVSYSGTAANCSADRVAPTNANATAGTTGQSGGGGGGGSGGTSSGLGGMGGRGGTFYGSPYRAGGGNAGGSVGLSPSTDTTHGDKGLGDTFNAGTAGSDGYVSLISCS